jgi:preprotein translocase subunit SecD
MIESLRVRSVLFFLFLLFCGVYLLPNAVNLPDSWFLHKRKLNYGLDIQGGAHLVYGVDVPGVITERIERMGRGLTSEFTTEKIDVESVTPIGENKDILAIKLKDAAAVEKATKYLKDRHGNDLDILKTEGNVIQTKFYEVTIEQWRSQIVNQAIEVIRNRVDEFGVSEPVIAAQGRDRILVQLPGITDPARAKELINKTARLDFRIVDVNTPPEQVVTWVAEAEKAGNYALGKDGLSYNKYVKRLNEDLKPKLPAATMIFFEKAPNATTMEAGKIPRLLRTDMTVSGDLLEDAFVRAGQDGEPTVSFRFGSDGRKLFGELTGKNVGRNLAIVLDSVIYSAPNIRERIEGEGQITLGARNYETAQKEGNLIATALRAGALPAALQQYEERSVGPSLGADSIAKGKRAGLIGLLLVVVAVSLYYRMFGVVAAVCLGFNVIGLLAVLSALGATLTLPGIAGITLTIGMAVDANVIIYERIKEEMARGVAIKAAIRDGFAHAWSAIFDSNVTNAIAASVLIYFGSGPVRGFGVTLIAGIITTMITAVFVTRYLLDILTSYTKPSKLWI